MYPVASSITLGGIIVPRSRDDERWQLLALLVLGLAAIVAEDIYSYYDNRLLGRDVLHHGNSYRARSTTRPLLQPLGLHIARLSPWTESRAMPCAGTACMQCVSDDDAVQGFGVACGLRSSCGR